MSDEAAVRALEAAYDEAWSSGDLPALMDCFSPDAVLRNPRGDVAIGRDAIREALGDFLGGEAAGSRHTSRLERVSFVRDDVAVVDGAATISGGALEAEIGHQYTDILVREHGRWSILHVRAYASGAGHAREPGP